MTYMLRDCYTYTFSVGTPRDRRAETNEEASASDHVALAMERAMIADLRFSIARTRANFVRV
jgi:hypothetical protein